MNSLLSDALTILYPHRCPLCDGILSKKEIYLCRKCSSKTEFLRQPLCKKCGVRLLPDENELCPECRAGFHETDVGFAPFSYEGFYRESILRFKYGRRPEYAFFYAAAIWNFGKEIIQKRAPQVIIPIPLAKKRLQERGYNQSLLIAEELSAICGIPVEKNALIKTKSTPDQKTLDAKTRKTNLNGVFAFNSSDIVPEHVLLIDDVRTTGSTFDEAARVLRDSGVRQVDYACVCI